MHNGMATKDAAFTPRRGLTTAVLMLGALLALAAPRPAQAAETPLLSYGVDVVSDYVSRGEDLFVSTFDKAGKPHESVNIAPAVQPSVTLHGPAGFSLGLWGSWALLNREAQPAKNFAGLKTLDEVDYTLSWGWDNRLGGFSAGWALYTYVPERAASNELFFSVAPKVLDSVTGTFTHWVVPDAGAPGAATYTQFAMSGSESVIWGVSFGMSTALQDVTAKVGMPLGAMRLTFNAAYRPNPELVGPYTPEGTYVDATGKVSDYPSVIVWLTLSYGGAVAP